MGQAKKAIDPRKLYADGWSFYQKHLRCTHGCCKGPRPQRHGPYWYASRRFGDQIKQRYIGAKLPKQLAALIKLDRTLNRRKKSAPASK